MPGPNYHARTHLLGGTDPLPINLPMAILSNDGLGDQLIDTDAQELIWGTTRSSTNAPLIFRFDPTDPAGLLIYQPGYYLCHAVVRVTSGSISVAKSIYQQAQPLSSGPGLFGNELGFPYGFSLGTGQGAAGIGIGPGPTGSTAKSEYAHLAITSMGDKSNPSRYVVACVKPSIGGPDWSVSASNGATAVVVKVADYFYGDIPAPDA